MWYTIWRPYETTPYSITYKFYAAFEHSTHAVQSAPVGAIITETEFSFNANFKTAEELSHYKKLAWFAPKAN